MSAYALLGSLLAYAAFAEAQVATATAFGLGEATVASAQVWGAATNPAASVAVASQTDAVGLTAQIYGISYANPAQLPRTGLDLGWVTGTRRMSYELSLQHFRPPGFDVTTLRVGSSKQLGDQLHVGVRFGVLLADFDEYGRDAFALAEGGFQCGISRTLSVGAHFGFIQRTYAPLAQQRLRLGVAYASSARVQLLAAASQAVAEPLNGQFGVSYRPIDRLHVNVGYQTLGQRVSFGTGYRSESGFRADLAVVVFSRLPLGVAYGIAR